MNEITTYLEDKYATNHCNLWHVSIKCQIRRPSQKPTNVVLSRKACEKHLSKLSVKIKCLKLMYLLSIAITSHWCESIRILDSNHAVLLLIDYS